MARFRSISNSFLLLLACSALPLSSARATEATKAGAAEVEEMVESYLAYLKESLSYGGAVLETGDTVLVEPTDNYYAVTLPSVRYVGADGESLELGMISLNAMPAATDGQWKMTMALPTPISLYTPEGALRSLVTIGGQNFAGIWHEDAQSFSKMNARYEDVAVLDSGHNPQVKMESITLVSDTVATADGMWSGPTTMAFNNVTAGDPDEKYMRVGQFAIRIDGKNASLAAMQNYEERINALIESQEAGEGADSSIYNSLGFYNLVTEYISTMADDLSMTVSVKDVAMRRPASGARAAHALTLANGEYGLSLTGLRGDSVGVGMNISYDGLDMPLDQNLVNSSPDQMNIDIEISQLPLQKIFALGRNSLQVTAQVPTEQVAGMAFLTTMMALPQVLSEAGSKLTISQSSIGNERYNVFIDGQFVADIEALYSATGQGTLRIRGIEAIVENVRSAMNTPGLPDERKAKLQKTMEALTILQIASEKQKAADGVVTHVYNLALTKEGQITLNGTDLSVLLQQ